MDVLLRPWRHYADFSGRSSRTEYFLFQIVFWGALFVAVALLIGLSSLGEKDAEPSGAAILVIVGMFLTALVPGWAVAVRRMHDQNKSGWFILINFVPYIGGLIFLVLCFMPGTEGENDYGWDPRQGAPDRTADIFR